MTHIPDWKNISYLKNGSDRQQKAYRVLTDIGIMNILSAYDPILTGTIPIGIDIASSDLDIICNSSDLQKIQLLITNHFGNYVSFSDNLSDDVYVASFIADGFEIEVFAQTTPSLLQNAYRHMVVEYRLLILAGERLRDEIIRLKEEGYKTEPAFGQLLGLSGPFEELLHMESLSDEDLTALLVEKGYA